VHLIKIISILFHNNQPVTGPVLVIRATFNNFQNDEAFSDFFYALIAFLLFKIE